MFEAERYKLLRNKCRCKICGAELESVSTHDFVSCPHIFADGGLEYIRRGCFKNNYVNSIEELCEWLDTITGEVVGASKPQEEKKIIKYINDGCLQCRLC